MTNPQAAVINKIDRSVANNATIDGLAVSLSQPTPKPTPPKATGLAAILLAAVDTSACYGVALFDSAANAKAAQGTLTSFWRADAKLGTAVHDPVVAATATPEARMVWVPGQVPIATHVVGLLEGLQRALDSTIRRIQPNGAATSTTTHGAG